jgi:hypothetical protein
LIESLPDDVEKFCEENEITVSYFIEEFMWSYVLLVYKYLYTNKMLVNKYLYTNETLITICKQVLVDKWNHLRVIKVL